MGNSICRVRSFINTIFLLSLVNVLSCDVFNSDEGENGEQALLNSDDSIVFTEDRDTFSNNEKANFKDEVVLHSNGEMHFQRLEGKDTPPSVRTLHEVELKHFLKIFSGFKKFNNECSGFDKEDIIIYTITNNRGDQSKTVRCSNSALSPEENVKLFNIVREFENFKEMLQGEVRFADKLSFDFKPVQSEVSLDEPIAFEYKVTNNTNELVSIGFGSSSQRGLKIFKDGELLFSSQNSFFASVVTQWEIPPSSTVSKTFEWNHRSDDGSIFQDRKVDSGTYTAIQFLVDGNSPVQTNENTITEEGQHTIQPRIIYNRFIDPAKFTYELNNRISKSFTFNFDSKRKVGFLVRPYDLPSTEPDGDLGEIIFEAEMEASSGKRIAIEPFENVVLDVKWNRKDAEGNSLPNGFYQIEMWLLDQDPKYRAERRVFIKN